MARFTLKNTNFLARDKDGSLAVFTYYPQGKVVHFLKIASTRTVTVRGETKVERVNHSNTGFNPYPKRYDSAFDALKGLVKPRFQNEEFDFAPWQD